MQIFCHLEDVPAEYGATLLSIGNFDGVHLAHQKVLKRMAQRSRELRAKAVAVTFEPHPIRILKPDAELKLITPIAAKLRLLAEQGLDATLILPFTRDLSLMSPREFVEQIVVRKLRAREVHEGFNFHFGHRAAGDVEALEKLGQEFGFQVWAYPEMKIRGVPVSSSQIRRCLHAGDVSTVRHLLGRVFSLRSLPGRGRGYGHKYTVPTINLARYDELTPQDGVFITRSHVGEYWFDSVTNVGVRPTFGPDSFAIESHILNFHPIALTAQTLIELFFLKRLRDEIRFPSVEALREQISQDVHKSRRYFHLLRRMSPEAAS